MNEQKTNHLKNLIIIMTGIVVSCAGIIYIAVQYSKLLRTILLKTDDSETEDCSARMGKRFRQVRDDEGVSPDTLDENDLSAEIN